MIIYKNNEIKSIKCSKEQILITWHMTGWCNYHCPYCIAKSFETAWINEDNIINISKYLNRFIVENYKDKRVCLRAVGGEITFYNLQNIFDNFEKLDKVNIATNFSNSLDYYKNLVKYFKNRKIQLILTCSYHEENKEFKSKFIKFTKWCRENGYKDPHMMIVITSDFDKTILNDYLKEDVWKIRLSPCRNNITMANEYLNDELLNFTQKYNEYYDIRVNEGLKNKAQSWNIEFKNGEIISVGSQSDLTGYLDNNGFIPDGYKCSVGIHSLTVLPNGDVILSRCEYLKDKIIGNIFDYKNIKLNTEPIVCKLNANTNGEKRCDLCSGANLERVD